MSTAGQIRLREELGLEPGGELRELQRLILQHDPTLGIAPAAAERLAALPAAPEPAARRARELAELRRLLLGERARLLVLTGAGGSGRTRLAVRGG
jgi:hypothetical protein